MLVRTIGGLAAAACALSLSGVAAVPVAERVARLVPDVASVTLPGQPGFEPAPERFIVTAEVDSGFDDEFGLFDEDGSAMSTASQLSASQLNIPAGVLRAYQRAADQLGSEIPECGLRWEILAGIGKVESNHARGGQLDGDGDTISPIIGPVLNGVGPVAAIRDTDGGEWDGDSTWDRAVGPMQFIPGTWRAYGVDATGSGEANPHNVWDATRSAGEYLCAGGADLTTDAGLRSALLRYNRSTTYVSNVINWINAYADGTFRPAAGGAVGGGSGVRSGSGSVGDSNDGDRPTLTSNTRTPTAKPSGKPSASPSTPGTKPSPTKKPTDTPDPTPTGTPTGTPTPTPTGTTTPGPTETPTPTGTTTPGPTETPTPTGTPTPTPTDTPTPGPTETPTPTPTPTETPTPTPTPTETPDPTPTPTPTPTDPDCLTDDELAAAAKAGDPLHEPDDECDDPEGSEAGEAGSGSGAARTEDD